VAAHTVEVTFRQALAYLLGDPIEFEDEEEVEERILNNNMDPDELDKAMVLVEQVGFGPGPDNAVMGIRSQNNFTELRAVGQCLR
jgi:L-fucose isomerase-like protein